VKSWRTKRGLQIIRILSGRSNVFLLSNGKKNILIDASQANKWNKLQKRLLESQIDHVDYLLLTHSHYDHADNAAAVKNKFGCPVLLHRYEEHNLMTGEFSAPKGTNLFTRFIADTLAPLFIHRLKCTPCQPDILVESVYDLSGYGFNAYILHTPGHSPGSVSVIVDDEIALVGDTMFGVFPWSVFPPYAADASLLVKSWGLLLETDCSIFLPSHGGLKHRSQLLDDYQRRKKYYSGYFIHS
jgi:hydroxyacylglutathione hydrolase